jgi:hypothetical protein
MPSKEVKRNRKARQNWSFKHRPEANEPRRSRQRQPLEDDTLFAFVIDYIERNQGRFPTLRVCADHFGTTLVAIENAVSCFDQTDKRGVDLIVAYRAGSGVAEITNRADYEVEAWSDGG